MKFENRIGTNLNKKVLEVENVERDESGEITLLEVKEYRNDEVGLVSEGTPLNASSMNEVVKGMIFDVIGKLDPTPHQRIQIARMYLEIPSVATSNFDLPIEGAIGCSISWSVVGSGITIRGSRAIVRDSLTTQTATLTATIEYENETEQFDFIVTIPIFTDLGKTTADKEALVLKPKVISDFDLPTTGEYGSTITWTALASEGALLNSTATRVIINRQSYNIGIRLNARISYGTSTLNKIFDVTVLATPAYTLSENSCNWHNNSNVLNDKVVNIYSNCQSKLYGEIVNNFSDYLNIEMRSNSASTISVKVTEKQDLCSTSGSASLELYFGVKVYLDEDRTVCLGTALYTINYHYPSSNPID